MVEVTFTVSPRVRRIAAHSPDELSLWEYYRQIFWSSGVDLPDDDLRGDASQEITLDAVELPAGEKAILSLQLPARVRHRLRAGDPRGAVHRREGRADAASGRTCRWSINNVRTPNEQP